MNKQQVVLRFLDGRIIKGYMGNFSPANNHISVVDERLNEQDIKINELKAVFYVKSFEGNKHYFDKKSFTKTSQRGGPQWLDSFGADLRWKPPAIMPPVLPDNLPLANSSMPHVVSCRPEKNEDAPHCNV
jgi:hypothetical protein